MHWVINKLKNNKVFCLSNEISFSLPISSHPKHHAQNL